MAGVYIHVPFCHAKCAYCAFYSSPDTSLAGRYRDAVVAEWRMRRAEINGGFDTLYFGGGTPSILPPDMIKVIADEIVTHSSLREFTIEANPEDITPTRISRWLETGVDRVSMGVQSLVDSELAIMGRRHSAADALRAVKVLRDSGVRNLSLDLIYGIPGQTPDSWQYSLDTILNLRPEHLSAYSLSYEPRTRLNALMHRGDVMPIDDDVAADMYQILISRTREAGYHHYEISNFALPGLEARHNSSYWDSTPYIGLGPGAHSFDGRTRRVNPSDTRRWLEAIESGHPDFEIDEETKIDRVNDTIITALRTSRGLDLADLPLSRRRCFVNDAFRHIKSGAIVAVDTRFVIPEDKWIVSDAILSDLIQS